MLEKLKVSVKQVIESVSTMTFSLYCFPFIHGILCNTPVLTLHNLSSPRCAVEETISIYPLSNFRMGFRFKPFKFVGHNLLYVHCNALVCRVEDNTRLCDRSCDNQKPDTSRRKRAIFHKVNAVVTSPVIVFYDPYAPKGSGGGSPGRWR